MAEKKTFRLPDLGEGLPDAEIVEWHVEQGASIRLDEPLVSMETAKAVVEVPSPYSGKVIKLHGATGDVIDTGAPLAEFELDPDAPQRAEAQDTGHGHGHADDQGKRSTGEPVHDEPSRDDGDAITVVASDDGGEIASDDTPAPKGRAGGDAGTVVGAMESSDRLHVEAATTVGGVKAMPAVRALAKKLKVHLTRLHGSGKDGVITLKDVREAAERGDAATPPAPAGRGAGGEGPGKPRGRAPAEPAPAALRAPPAPAGRGDRGVALDVDEPIRGVRRNMLRTMSAAHAEVVPTTLMDGADLHAWAPGEDITVRLIRALACAAQAVPALNSWLDAKQGTLRRHSRVDVGIAVDTPEGLFVPALRHCERLDAQQARAGIDRIREQVKTRSIPPEELRNYTIMLSNFGVFAGKYATPIVVPPCVAIVAAGRLFHEAVPVIGGIQAHRTMPLSLTFDHRACTGGEAARFLRALIDDLQAAN
ncbi:MAG TPA: dihydrolipoamide acetyltransferase family protein [Xanthomonadaceae bacterium]|nr:dihydrolipoamide acetyltransferase family protein [Xanthomonadaceae bacterium]